MKKVLFVLLAAALALAGCAGPERKAPPGEAPRPPVPRPPERPVPPGAEAPSDASKERALSGRPVRVQVAASEGVVRIEGEGLRIYSPNGSLLAESGIGAVVLSAHGGRIRWGSAGSAASPVDVTARAGLRLRGERLPPRLRVSAQGKGVSLVAVVPLEEYVARVLTRETPRSFRREALAAQAVAVRTYAEAAMARPKGPDHDLVATVDDQVFSGDGPIEAPFRDAVTQTVGLVLLYDGKPARTVYHSTCGGRTESAAEAWGSGAPYLRSVACDDCRESPVWRWEYRMDEAEGKRVAAHLGVRAGSRVEIDVSSRTSTGRAARVRLSAGGVEREAPAAAFRKAAGYARVRSLKMEIRPVKNGWVILGEGYGHGVGMCQWGANGMAARGAGFREILSRYYPGTTLGEKAS